ncbi:DUF1959 domain-containing protein [Methanobrevibacter olleyae]|uniref:Energy-converting hydrogenase A subunit M n=1 Tax=Methanobrevibacter olleyae TaxID=294671 RepID=A0A126R1E4_METOL|nr:DUF1959 domain-containing protein [Methanobrevibacter olleyae]AMK15455.1 energy-converting hydrogenase A subunit M EhaM [Methanobrevibacter olleyae]SFL56729.1 energy-converting hydrogenase A subunit M [Methanobrevibacter olleyae]
MSNEEKLEMMKLRVLHSFYWENDITIPLSEEFNISKEEFEDILMNHFDMSDLENMHATYEIANREKIKRQLHIDLRLYWLSDVIKLVSEEDADRITHNLTKDIVKNGKKYEDALEEGRAEIIDLVKEK